ncbi:site-specific integrase [Virgibacillus subterraneus]|nr:site-specific integrase [Virgibacillus subterraneus]
MKLHHAIDDYLAYVEVEKNCSVHTIHAYSFDLHCLERF